MYNKHRLKSSRGIGDKLIMRDKDNTSEKIKRKSSVSMGFVRFHATAANGGAMAINATIATYFSLR